MSYDLGNHYLVYIWIEISQIKSFLIRDIGLQGNSLIIEWNHNYFQYNKYNLLPISRDLKQVLRIRSIVANYSTMV